MKKAELLNQLVSKSELTIDQVKKALDSLTSIISDELSKKGVVKIQKFASFGVKERKPRKYKGSLLPAKNVVSVSFSKNIAELLNPLIEPESKSSYNESAIQTGIVAETHRKYVTTKPKTQIKPTNRTRKREEYNSPKESPLTILCEEEENEQTTEYTTILSSSNPNQTSALVIKYEPNQDLCSEDGTYPIVRMPQKGCHLKLPRDGRSNIRGYKEVDFTNALKESDIDAEVCTEYHLAIPYSKRPYEPDIVLKDETIGLFIDIEIDEPYDGYYRLPTHHIELNECNRDRFFTESGWIVIRFTERQVHLQTQDCVQYIKRIVCELKGNKQPEVDITKETQWTAIQSNKWERELYREKYLRISSFGKISTPNRIVVEDNDDGIEQNIRRTKIYPENSKIITDKNQKFIFDETAHVYCNINNLTGSGDYNSVTTIINSFFPFDEERYIEMKCKEGNRKREDVVDELKKMKEDATNRGTDLHSHIEMFLKGAIIDDSSIEFKYFLNFYNNNIRGKLTFVDAEKEVFLHDYCVAGTIDSLFQNANGEYIMVDWKRSKNLLINGRPKKFGYGRGLSILRHLDSSSYYEYELQQSFYKYILEKEEGIIVKDMYLVVLHPIYERYYPIKIDKYRKKEVEDILQSLLVIKK